MLWLFDAAWSLGDDYGGQKLLAVCIFEHGRTGWTAQGKGEESIDAFDGTMGES